MSNRSISGAKPVVALIVLVSLVAVQAAMGALILQTTPSADAYLLVVASKSDPVPAIPGSDLLFNVLIENWGEKPAENVTVRIIPDDHIKLKSEAERTFTLPLLCSICTTELNYHLLVDSDAPTGEYKIKIGSSWTTTSGTKAQDSNFNVTVKGSPKFVISKVTYEPGEAEPGKSTKVTISIENRGTRDAQNALLSVNTAPAGTTGKSPFSIVGSGNQFFLGNVRMGEKKTVSFTVVVDPEAAAGGYNLPINISSNEGSQNDQVGISVKSRANLKAPRLETDPRDVVPGEPFLLSITIENAGKDSAKSVRVDLLRNEFLTGQASSYLGTIKADDKDTALFELTAAADPPKKLPLVFNVSYTDDVGDRSFTETDEITVAAIGTGAEGGEKQFPIIPAAGALAVIVLGWWFFFRRVRTNTKGR